MGVKLIDYDRNLLELSWGWLNDPLIKELTDTPKFKKEDQENWFKTIADKKDYLIWGLAVKDSPIGVCGLKNITDYDGEYWGYIGDKSYWGKGFGSQMVKLIEKKGRSLDLNSLWLQVLKSNTRAIRLYNKCDFFTENETEKFYYMRKKLK